MSLLSLLIALAAEKSLSSSFWRFDHYYQKYVNFYQHSILLPKLKGSTLSYTLFLLLPVTIIYVILSLVGDGLLHFILSTLVLIICFGCFTTRSSYKQYLQAANQDEETTSKLHHLQLLQDKNLPPIGFGQALIWLNYRYYIAIMLFFTFFGATGVVFYRLLTTVIEQQNGDSLGQKEIITENENLNKTEPQPCEEESIKSDEEIQCTSAASSGCKNYHDILFFLDWLPVRMTTFGYMFVGHFSKALPIWLESFFDVKKPAHKILSDVAEKSEDILVDKNDCTAEPCLLVRLSKRNVLLFLATTAALTLFGVIR